MTALGKVASLNDSHVMTLLDGRDLGWLELGSTDGWPIFGFHGTPGSRLQMAIDEAAVRRAGVRLIAPDRPGYGLSTFQPGRRLVDWPSDVAELADHLAIDRFSVMGVSGGGPHAVVCASLLEERVVAAGIVSGEGPLSDPRISVDMTRSTKLLTTLSRRRSKILRAFFDAEIAFAQRWPAKALDLMSRQLPPPDAELLRRPDLRALFERDVKHASRTTGRAQAQDFELFASDWGFDLAAITVPVVLWQGDADRNVPPQHARVMREAMPSSTLHTFDGEGHFLVVDHLEEILVALKA
jgi:pimeloyl-ACP methyl ester carboxylesterase